MKEKAYIARDKNGDLYIYTKWKPYKGDCVWCTGKPYCSTKIDNNILPEIKWEDKEPTEVSIEIVSQQTREQPNQQIKFDPKTLKPFDKVIVTDSEHYNWKCDLFSHIVEHSNYSYRCIGNVYKYCIPYNEETEHLIGTTDEAPEYYRYWK